MGASTRSCQGGGKAQFGGNLVCAVGRVSLSLALALEVLCAKDAMMNYRHDAMRL